MIEHILPAKVATAEAFTDPSDAWLFPEETEAVARAVDKRRREFTTARACARQALERLGVGAAPVPRGTDGAPQWPGGVVGSITHCAGYRACAVARAGDVASVGIDAEPNEATPKGVLTAVSDHGEREHLEGLPGGRPGIHWDRLLFSAKESVYKAWYPLTGRWLGFEDASISIDPGKGAFTAHLRVPGPIVHGDRRDIFNGRWVVSDGLIITAVCITSEDGPQSSLILSTK